MEELATGTSQESKHPSNRVYIGIAAILAVITAIEVMVFYVDALRPAIVPILLVLSATKFALVVMFFMHLRFDSRVFSAVFLGPLLVIVALITAMLALYGVFTGNPA
ncbi:MAG: cytochrome C oxidase subunit IV family protein [Gemmatimonadota bacterium]